MDIPLTRRSAVIRQQVGDRSEPAAWGMLAPLTLVAAAGLFSLSAAFMLVPKGSPAGEPLYWLSFVVIALPIVLRLARLDVTTRERVALLLVLGLALYLVRFLRSPDGLTGYDELQHLRSLADIVATGQLFGDNPLLTVSPRYPGLETLVAAVVQVSGADSFAAAVVVLGAIRILFVLGLFGLYRAATDSDRVAGMATVTYMLNPNFMFFDAQFAYETLALALLPALLLGVAMLGRRRRRSRLWLGVFAILATIVVTHHVTAFAAAGLLLAWLALRVLLGRRDRMAILPLAITAVAAAAAATAWLLLVAPVTLHYLGGPFAALTAEFARLVGTGEGRALFQSATGVGAPTPERVIGLSVAAMFTMAIPIGLAVIWQRLRHRSLAMLLGIVALGYPAGLLGRLLPTGSEAAGRSLAIIFLGLALVVALAVIELLDAGPERLVEGSSRLRRLVAATAGRVPGVVGRLALVIAIGATVVAGVILGSAPATRFPGPYLVEADTRSVDAQSIGAARWLRETLGRDVPIAADRVNRLLLGSYGEADVRFHGSLGVDTWQIFLSPSVGSPEIARLRQAGIRYVLIDRRLSSALPLARFYYEEGEVFEGPHKVPVSADVLAKWDAVGGVQRIFDSGPIQVYDVGRLVDA
jgi:Family of unknown function (DUF6541)